MMRIKYRHRPSDSLMGRFGGGWQWSLGFQLGAHTLIVNLLIFSLRIEWGVRP